MKTGVHASLHAVGTAVLLENRRGRAAECDVHSTRSSSALVQSLDASARA